MREARSGIFILVPSKLIKDPSDKDTIQAIKADLENSTGAQFIVVNNNTGD